MHYIFLDLEWDNAFCKQQNRFVNEIIEIGAVELDEDYNEIRAFRQVVKSRLTKKLSKRFTALTCLSDAEMLLGVPFKAALDAYIAWANPKAVTLTWSNSDLYTLLDNCKLFTPYKEPLPCIGLYADLQRYYQAEMQLRGDKITNQISLSHAAERLGIPLDGVALHHACDDSRLAADIFKRVYESARFTQFIADASQPSFYKRLTFTPYIVSNIKDKAIDQSMLRFTCDVCGRRAKRLEKWQTKSGGFRAKFYCENCKRKFIGALRVKKYYDHVKVKRSIRPILNQRSTDENSDKTSHL